MPQFRRGARFPDKALPGLLAVEMRRVDDLQRHRDAQPGVEPFVSDAHRPAAEFAKRTIVASHHFIVFKGDAGWHERFARRRTQMSRDQAGAAIPKPCGQFSSLSSSSPHFEDEEEDESYNE